MKNWKTKSSELVFDTKWVKVHKDIVELPDGNIIDNFYTWGEQNVSQVVAVTKNNKILLVKQYKYASKEFFIECPAGYLNDNETFDSAAKRELLEETGYTANNFELIGKLVHTPGKSSSIVSVFLAKPAEKVSNQKLDEDEEIEVLEFSFEEVIRMINEGDIWASGTISSIFLALNKLKYKNELS